jgi:hypothetical protein
LFSQDFPGAVDRNFEEPGGEFVLGVEGIQGVIGVYKDIGGGVFGVLRGSQEVETQVKDSFLEVPDDWGERVCSSVQTLFHSENNLFIFHCYIIICLNREKIAKKNWLMSIVLGRQRAVRGEIQMKFSIIIG